MSEGRMWEFYEEMNEIVYVADTDSHELVYMNRRAREVFGVGSVEELQGRKCHELLYGSLAPCALCSNRRLRPGFFLEEARHNPTLNRRFALKQTVLEEEGRRLRFELAVDLGAGEQSDRDYEANAVMVNEGLRVSMSAYAPEESIAILLEYLGQALKSERIYIFEETDDETLNNTYEWCANDVAPQRESLQNVPLEVVEPWYRCFRKGENVIIKDLESLREEEPVMYGYLKPQNIRSVVVSPLTSEGKIIGFYGVDNPPERFLGNITALFQILGHFMVSLLHRRNHVKKLEALCFQDQLTGIGNRHAMNEYISSLQPERSVGILFCDVMGLKKANDTMGHREGDKLLIRASECLKSQFGDHALFRVGGDEFLALCAGIGEKELGERIEALKAAMGRENANMAIGCVWRPDSRADIDRLITEADDLMYEDKRAWYGRS